MTTASEVPAPLGVADNTWASSDCPATGCRTFGVDERIRVPSPAASTMVRLVLPLIKNPWIVLSGRSRSRPHRAFSRQMETGFAATHADDPKIAANFLLMFGVDSAGP